MKEGKKTMRSEASEGAEGAGQAAARQPSSAVYGAGTSAARFRVWFAAERAMLGVGELLFAGGAPKAGWTEYSGPGPLSHAFFDADRTHQIMAWTGRDDASGKPIYELDIVRCRIRSPWPGSHGETISEDFVAVYDREALMWHALSPKDGLILSLGSALAGPGAEASAEVVGNVYESPELAYGPSAQKP